MIHYRDTRQSCSIHTYQLLTACIRHFIILTDKNELNVNYFKYDTVNIIDYMSIYYCLYITVLMQPV